MAKKESIRFLTPWFTARFPKISQMDTEGKFADGKYKTDGVLSDEDYAAVEKVLKDAAKKLWPEVDLKDIRLPLVNPFYNNKEDKKAKRNPQGKGFRMKSQYRPAVFDGKKQKLPEGVKIGGGSIIRVAAFIFPWGPKTVQVRGEDINEWGVSLRLGDVQVRKLVEHQAQGDGSAFDEDEEGFVFESVATGADQFGDATDL